MEIRRAEEKDVAQIERLLFQVHKVHSDIRPDLFIPGQKKYTTQQLMEIIADDQRPIFVAIDEDESVLGYSFCVIIESGSHSTRHMKTLYIDDLCVDEMHRGKRVGRTLYDYVVNYAKEIGCYNLTLNVWENNESAKKFYDSCGLKIQKYGMEHVL